MNIPKDSRLRNFHQAKWDEEVIFELSNKGERGILVPEAAPLMNTRASFAALSNRPTTCRHVSSGSAPSSRKRWSARHWRSR